MRLFVSKYLRLQKQTLKKKNCPRSLVPGQWNPKLYLEALKFTKLDEWSFPCTRSLGLGVLGGWGGVYEKVKQHPPLNICKAEMRLSPSCLLHATPEKKNEPNLPSASSSLLPTGGKLLKDLGMGWEVGKTQTLISDYPLSEKKCSWSHKMGRSFIITGFMRLSENTLSWSRVGTVLSH